MINTKNYAHILCLESKGDAEKFAFRIPTPLLSLSGRCCLHLLELKLSVLAEHSLPPSASE